MSAFLPRASWIPRERDVVHLDVAAFAVAVERVREPRLRGRPVVVAPPTPRGVVLDASFEARHAGIGRGMPVGKATRLCREVIVLTPDEPLYARAAAAVREILGRFTPLVEPASGGRWFLDLTGTRRLFGPPVDVASRLAREVEKRLRLTAAVGVAVNKTVSRVAADVTEPFGLLDVAHGDEASFLAPLPAARLPGVTGEVGSTLSDLNIRIVREIAEVGVGHLTMLFGRMGIVLHERALGIDPSPVRVPEAKPAVVEEAAFAEDTNDLPAIESALFELCRRAGRGLRRRGVTAGRLEVALRYADGEKNAALAVLREPADLDPALFREASSLLARALTRRVRVRGLTLRATSLARRPRQLTLFEEPERRREIGLVSALGKLRAKYGDGIVVFAGREAAGVETTAPTSAAPRSPASPGEGDPASRGMSPSDAERIRKSLPLRTESPSSRIQRRMAEALGRTGGRREASKDTNAA